MDEASALFLVTDVLSILLGWQRRRLGWLVGHSVAATNREAMFVDESLGSLARWPGREGEVRAARDRFVGLLDELEHPAHRTFPVFGPMLDGWFWRKNTEKLDELISAGIRLQQLLESHSSDDPPPMKESTGKSLKNKNARLSTKPLRTAG